MIKKTGMSWFSEKIIINNISGRNNQGIIKRQKNLKRNITKTEIEQKLKRR